MKLGKYTQVTMKENQSVVQCSTAGFLLFCSLLLLINSFNCFTESLRKLLLLLNAQLTKT